MSSSILAGVAIPGLQAMQRGFVSDLRKRGEPVPGKDVAILKIDKTNLPTVRLGDHAAMTTGDRIYVIATFGSIDYQRGGAEVQGMNFLVPISVAKQFLAEINVRPHESQLSRLYEQGLAYYDKHQYKNALEKFREVNELNPGGYQKLDRAAGQIKLTVTLLRRSYFTPRYSWMPQTA